MVTILSIYRKLEEDTSPSFHLPRWGLSPNEVLNLNVLGKTVQVERKNVVKYIETMIISH